MNFPNQLDANHPTTSFSADQKIQIARAVRLKGSFTSYGMLQDVVLNARLVGVGQTKTSNFPLGKLAFPSVSGSTMDLSVASQSAYSLPAITEVEGSQIVVGEKLLQEPCSSKQADARLADGHTRSEKPSSDSLKTLQRNRLNEKKKQSRKWKWSRENRSNALLPNGNNKGRYVFTEEMLELASFAKVFATGLEDPLENNYCFYCMLCRRNISLTTRGFYESKRHFQ